MKREEAIYCLKAQSERYSEVCEECPLYGQTGVDHCCDDALQMAITALHNQPVWIPVSERLPEEYGSYLVAWRSVLQSKEMVEKLTGGLPHFFEILEYDPDDESGWIESIEQATGEYEILAWMPLPEPYRENEEENGK